MNDLQQIRDIMQLVKCILDCEANWHRVGIINPKGSEQTPKEFLLKYAYKLILEETNLRSRRGY